MSEDTTTSDSGDSGADNAQLEDTDVNTEAVNQDEDISQTSDSTDDESEEDNSDSGNSEEEEIKDWAAKKNLPLDDPIKMAKMYRESEKQLGKKGQQEGQLKAAVTDANSKAGTEEMQSLKNEVAALGFYIQHPEAKNFEQEMVTILEDKPWLANDLEVVLDAAKGRSTTDAATRLAERKAGGKEALDTAANAARGAPPKASANQSGYSNNKITLDNVDSLIAKNGHDWYMKNRDKINSVLAG